MGEQEKRIVIDVCRDRWTNGLQLGIGEVDENGGGHGYRIAGPKYNGSSTPLLKHVVDERDAREIRQYLDAAFPPVVYRAAYEADITPALGQYSTARAAREHCEDHARLDYPGRSVDFEWAVDEDDTDVLALDVRVDGSLVNTDFTVTAVHIPRHYDPEADQS